MLAPDTVLQNRYRVVRKIGQGGMGAVYEAVDLRFNNVVALKENLVQEDSLTKAFEREARTLNALRHAALPVVIDYFSEGNGLFLIMQFIPGDDLGAILEKRKNRVQPIGVPKPFELDEIMSWAEQLLDVLDYLHAQQPPIIHRDIKPQNIKLTGRSQIVLLDFGLAKGTASQLSQVVSNASVFGYTPLYAPLEQMNSGGTDARSDLYSLAATLYHLLTGIAPINALARVSAVTEGRLDPLQPIQNLNPRIPTSVAAVLWRAMSLNREARPATAIEMRKLLREALQDTTMPTISAMPQFGTAPQESQDTTPQNHTTMPAGLKATKPQPQVSPFAAAPPSPHAGPGSQSAAPATSQPQIYSVPPALEPTAPKSNKMWLWIGGGVAALLVAAIAAFIALQSPNLPASAPSLDTSTASKSRTSPTPLGSRELFGRGRTDEAFYSFTAGPGDVKLTLNVIAAGGSVIVELYDDKAKKLSFAESGDSFRVYSSYNHNEQGSAKVYLERQQEVLMRLAYDYPDSVSSYRLRLDGQLDTRLKATSAGDNPLAAPFTPRDNPSALTAKEIIGRSNSLDSYYAVTAGPGDLKVWLSLIANGAAVGVELFDEGGKKIKFDASNELFKVFSSYNQDERAVSQIYLEKEQKLLLRISQEYPDSVLCYRVHFGGAIGGNLPEKSGNSWSEKFAPRDAPQPLPGKEITGRSRTEDAYYEFWAEPGELILNLGVTADGGAVKVELYEDNIRKIKFPDSTDAFKVYAAGKQEKLGSVKIPIEARRKLVMRLSQEYPDSVASYHLQIDNTVAAGKY